MWESRERFPRWVGRVGILVLDFHSFHPPSFPQAFWFPAVELMLERIEPADLQRAVKNFVVAIVAGPQAERLSAEKYTHEKSLVFPVQISFLRNAPHENAGVIFDLRHAPWKRPQRPLITAPRRLIDERFMRTLLVIDFLPSMKRALLLTCRARRRRQRFLLQAAMHALMPAVVLRRRRSASLGHNPQSHPPHRKTA